MQEEVIKAIIARRKMLKISQRELAKLIDVDRSHVGKVERLKISPTLGTIEKMFNALGLELIVREKQ